MSGRAVVLAFGLSFFALFPTVLVDQTADSRAEARALGFGYPIRFVFGDYTVFTPPRYPETYAFDPWEIVTWVDPLRFFASWGIVLALALGAAALAGRAAARRR